MLIWPTDLFSISSENKGKKWMNNKLLASTMAGFYRSADNVFSRHGDILYFLDDVHLMIPRKQNMESTVKQLFFSFIIYWINRHYTSTSLQMTDMDLHMAEIMESPEDIIVISDDDSDMDDLQIVSDDSEVDDDDIYIISDDEDEEDLPM